MKKVVVLFSILLVGFTSQAISLDTLANKTMAVVDSAKKNVVNTVNTVDTSRLSKQIYTDFKSALAGIAAALKVGVEHVYIVLVKQQIVKAIYWLLVFAVPLILLIIFYRRIWTHLQTKDWDGLESFVGVVLFVVWCIPIAIGIGHLNIVVTGFVNPEYGAMLDIMDFVEKIRAK